MRPRRAWSIRASQVSGPAPITTKVTLCAICQAELPFKAQKCPSCGAARTELKRPPVAIVSPLQAAAAIDDQSNGRSAPVVGTATGIRFGIGFALGALVIVGLAWLAINAAQGAGGVIAFDLKIGSPTVATFNGSGPATSEPFRLGGDVDVEWTVSPNDPNGCRIRAILRVASNPSEYQVLVDGNTATQTSGTQAIDHMIDNQYLIDVDSTCSWSFRVKH